MSAVVKEETSSVVCNASQLQVEDAAVLVDGEEIKGSLQLNQETEELTFKLGEQSTLVRKET